MKFLVSNISFLILCSSFLFANSKIEISNSSTSDSFLFTSPTVVSVSNQNATNVSVSANITATFSESMDVTSFVDSSVVVSGSLSGRLSGIISYDSPSNTMTFNPTSDFLPGETIQVVLSSAILNSTGTDLASAYVYSFKVAATGNGHLQFADTLKVDQFLSKTVNVDVDNDGDEDLVARQSSTREFVVYKNSGGTYTEFSNPTNSEQIDALFSGDIDEDGDVDFLVKLRGSAIVVSAENDGVGNFTLRDSTTVNSSNLNSLEVSDFDGDGHLDFAYLDISSSFNIHWGNGYFTFPSSTTITPSVSFTKATSSDIDNDGDIDLVITDGQNSQLETFINQGNRAFTSGSIQTNVSSSTAFTTRNPEMADFDNDGYFDLMVPRKNNGFQILINQGDGTFGVPVSYYNTGNLSFTSSNIFDYDGDGDSDLTFKIQGDEFLNTEHGFLILYNKGNGEFGNEDVYFFNSGAPDNYTSLNTDYVVSDNDGDGDLDIVANAGVSDDGYIVVLENTPASSSSPTQAASNTLASDIASYSATVSWTNGDGDRRLVVVKEGSAVNTVPTDDGNFEPNTNFGAGTELGSGNYVVHVGVINKIFLTGLAVATDYHVQIFELNGPPGSEKILTTGAPSFSFTTLEAPLILSKDANSITFTKSDYADATLTVNQDQITDSVWFTRANSKGLFNVVIETSSNPDEDGSPRGTLWAIGSTDTLRGAPENLANLQFDTFYRTLDEEIGSNIVGTDMVVYLQADNVYMDIKFSSWTPGGNGGGFSYTRSALPELIQQADTTLTAYSDSAYVFTTAFFQFGNNYADSALSLSIIGTQSGNLFVDENANFTYDDGTDSLATSVNPFLFTSTGSKKLMYEPSGFGIDSVSIKMETTSIADTINLKLLNVEGAPSILGTADEGGWYLLSNPFTTSIGELLDNMWTQGAINSDAPNGSPTLYTFSQDSSVYVPITTDLDTTKLSAGQGLLAYLFAFNDLNDGVPEGGGWPKVLSNYGNPFSEYIDIALKNVDHDGFSGTSGSEGFALLGNPYGWSLSADSVIATLKREDPFANSYVYLWDPVDKLYYLKLTGEIKPYQSFFVRTISSDTTANLSFDYNDSYHTVNRKTRSNQTIDFELANQQEEMVSFSSIRFAEQGETGIDPYDGYYLGSYASKFANLYTLIGDQTLTINNLPENIEGDEEFPFYLHASVSGKFDLTWSNQELPEGLTFELEHTLSGEIINLKEVNEYSFEAITKSKAISSFHPLSSEANVKTKEALQPTFVLKVTGTLVNTESNSSIPTEVELYQNYPNPFNPTSIIKFGVPKSAKVQLEVFDILGRKVATLLNNEIKQPGRYNIQFNAKNLASGMYIYRLVIGDKILTKKMTLIK